MSLAKFKGTYRQKSKNQININLILIDKYRLGSALDKGVLLFSQGENRDEVIEIAQKATPESGVVTTNFIAIMQTVIALSQNEQVARDLIEGFFDGKIVCAIVKKD